MRPYEPTRTSTSLPRQVKPFFIWIEIAPPSALRPYTGLFGTRASRLIAISEMKSQLTVSPNTSLMRTPF